MFALTLSGRAKLYPRIPALRSEADVMYKVPAGETVLSRLGPALLAHSRRKPD
jgi:hypothetical protein